MSDKEKELYEKEIELLKKEIEMLKEAKTVVQERIIYKDVVPYNPYNAFRPYSATFSGSDQSIT